MTTVTPTRRLAHWLRVRHADDCLARGLDVWRTPEIVAWSDFVRGLYFHERESGRTGGRWLTDEAAALLWEGLVRDDPATEFIVAPGLLGRTAHRSWRLMHAWDIPARALATEDRPEAAAFARWTRQYSDRLSKDGWVDEPTAVTWLGSTCPGAALELAGFDELTPAQRALVARIEESGVAVTHRLPATRRGSAVWVECRDRRAEIDAAVRWAAGRLDRDPRSSLAIVVPDLATTREEVRRAVDRVLAPASTLTGGGAPGSRGYELAAARGLSRQPLVEAALDVVAAFANRADLAAASRLLRACFIAGSATEREARARFDAWLRGHEGPDLGLGRLAHLAAGHGCPQFARTLESALSVADDWPRRALPSRWSHVWSRLLAAVDWPGSQLDSAEHQAHRRWQQLLADVGASDECVGPVSATAAAAILRDQAERVLFEPEEVRAQLTVIDAETCAGMTFDALWVCGLDSARWPPAPSPDPFLPREWQVRQRVPGATADIAADGAQRLLARLVASADEVVLSAPQFEDEAPLLPSALLAKVPCGESPAGWQARVPAVAYFDARPVLERETDGAMPPLGDDEEARGGARILELQSACPFRAQAEFRLGARPLEDPELGVAATERGELAHDVLARIWRELRDQPALLRLSPADLRATVRTAVAAASSEARASAHGFMRRLLELEADWIEARVMEMLVRDAARAPFAVESVEHDCTVAIGGLSLALRVDRVDRLEDGGLAVIDYKTGGELEPRAWLGERPRSPQLPLYAEALGADEVSAVAFGKLRTGDTGYSGLARDAGAFPGLASPGAGAWPKDLASWDALRAEWRRRLEALATEHVAGDARLAPDPPRACTYCHLRAFCRIAEAQQGRGAEEAGDE